MTNIVPPRHQILTDPFGKRSDERKPTCRKCGVLDRACTYEPLKTWLFVPGAKEPPNASIAPALPGSLPTGSAKGEELRALSFFRERTSPSLSAFSRFTRHFFIEIIPQLSAAENAVRSMTVALAARQELVSCSSDRLYDLSMIRSSAV